MNGFNHAPMQNNVQELLLLQAKLFKKIHTVVSTLEKVEKSGYNKHQNYHYTTEKDLVDAIRDRLLTNNIIILTDSETKEVIKLNKPDGKGGVKESLVSIVNTRHTFCDIETGATYSVQSTGSGWDDTDKFVYKSLTGAMKYFVSKNFLVATEDDPEDDGVTAKKQSPQNTTPKTGFNRTANTIQVTATSTNGVVKTETKVIDIPKEPNDSTQVHEKFNTPTSTLKVEGDVVQITNSQPKPSFGRRSITKPEPNFP